MNISYRSAALDDEEFLYALHRAAMREYIVETWGAWDEAWQRAYFHRHFHPGTLQIIQLEGRDVGTVSFEERGEEFFLERLEIFPVFQGRGVGSAVVRALLEQARGKGKPVALKVLKANRRARSLYQRLGFGVTGESETHYIMAFEVRE